MRAHLAKEIGNLQRLVSELAAEVEDAVRKAVTAARERDDAAARELIAHDDVIDQHEIAIEEECLKILALHQPVAGDLRYIITFLKVNGELERIGDLAANIAGRAVSMAEDTVKPEVLFDFDPLVSLVRQMLKRALDALVARNCLEASEVIRDDRTVDTLSGEICDRAVEQLQKQPGLAGYCTDVILIAKHLERIGDCTTNICEDIVYLELGKIIRHGGRDSRYSGELPE